MALSEIDRHLLKECLARKPRSWEDFVDRFLGLVIHVVQHTAQARSIRLTTEDREDLAAEVFLTLLQDDFAVLRNFRGESSLATYLTVVARRVVVRELLRNKPPAALGSAAHAPPPAAREETADLQQRLCDRDEIEQLLTMLSKPEAEIVRLYHLEGRTYQEISARVGIPANSIGPTLTRARTKMRQSAGGSVRTDA